MYERIGTLIERLLERTKTKALKWEQNPSKNFEASFPNYTVELAACDQIICLQIYNDEGEVLESTTTAQLNGTADLYKHANQLENLYEMARRTALGSDQAVESLIAALED